MEQESAARLAELECETVQLEQWTPLRKLLRGALQQEPTPERPSEEIMYTARHLIHDGKSQSNYLYAFWEKRGGGTFPFERYCFFGHFTALYVIAWNAAVGQHPSSSLPILRQANMMLRLDDHDFLDHTSWPFGSWDLLMNLHAIENSRRFVPRWPRVFQDAQLGKRLPLVWPAFARTCWYPMLATTSATRSGAAAQLAPRRRVSVWWTAKHPGPFVDIVTIMEQFMSDRYDVQMHSNAVSEYCEYPLYRDWVCSSDAAFAEGVLKRDFILSHISQAKCGEARGQWCGLRELHEEFEVSRANFEHLFQLRKMEVDLFMCGHPLYWCSLFERMETPIIGVWEMSHHFAVPAKLQESWHASFMRMFTGKRNLLIGFCAFHSFQARWLLGFNVPYYPPIALSVSMSGRYAPVYNDTVLLGDFHTPYDVELLKRFAVSLPGFPLKIKSWPDDLACGTNCPKSELARFRAVVLDAYDTSTLKLAEFYAMHVPIFIDAGALWRTGMRWAKASGRDAGPNATVPGLIPPSPINADGWHEILSAEMSSRQWEMPWPIRRQDQNEGTDVAEPSSDSNEHANQELQWIGDVNSDAEYADTAVAHFLYERLCVQRKCRLEAVEFEARLVDQASTTEPSCFQVYRPIRGDSSRYTVVAEDCATQVVPRIGRDSSGKGVAFARGGIHLETGDCIGWYNSENSSWRISYRVGAERVLLSFGARALRDSEIQVHNHVLDRAYNVRALLRSIQPTSADPQTCGAAGPQCADQGQDAKHVMHDAFPFTPYIVNRAEMHPVGAVFWSQFTDWNLRLHLVRYYSAGDLLAKLQAMSQPELMEVSRRMGAHYIELQTALINFWRSLVVSLIEERDVSAWRDHG